MVAIAEVGAAFDSHCTATGVKTALAGRPFAEGQDLWVCFGSESVTAGNGRRWQPLSEASGRLTASGRRTKSPRRNSNVVPEARAQPLLFFSASTWLAS
jgi:hypothetical protein